MSGLSPPLVIFSLYQLGLLILAGSLFFGVLVYLPQIARLDSPRQRRELRLALYRQVLRWSWVGLALLWAALATAVVRTLDAGLPLYLLLMLALAAAVTALLLLAQFALYMRIIDALDDNKTAFARWLERWLRLALRLELPLVLAMALVGSARQALVG